MTLEHSIVKLSHVDMCFTFKQQEVKVQKGGHQETHISFHSIHRFVCTNLSMAASKNSTNRTVLSRGLMVCVVGRRLLSWLNREDTRFSSLVTEMPAFSSTAFRPASRTASITLYMSIRCTGMSQVSEIFNEKYFLFIPLKKRHG